MMMEAGRKAKLDPTDMESSVAFRESHLAICPSSAVIAFAETFFVPRDGARMPSVRVMLDRSDCKGWRTTLELAWSHSSEFRLPNFHGSLTARPTSVNAELTLEGSYARDPLKPDAPPDARALATARAGARALLAQIASHCESQWKYFSNGCPSIATCNDRSAAGAR